MRLFLILFIFASGIFAQSRFDVEKDDATNAMITIDYPHHEIHDERHYFVEGYELMGSGDSLIFLFNCNDTTRWAHLLFSFNSTTSLHIQMYENAISGGAPLDTLTTRLTPVNNNRNSSNTTVHDVFYGSTIVGFINDSLGTVLYADSIGVDGGNPFRPDVGGSASRDNEIILKQNTSYLWILVSKAADNIVRFKGSWYEHINAN